MFARKFVGQDEYGNRYYQRDRKRFVEFKGESWMIEPMWHAWLHHIMPSIPQKIPKYPWQDHSLKDNRQSEKRESYEAWNPD